MHDALKILAVDRHLQGMRVLQGLGYRQSHVYRKFRGQRPVTHQFRKILAIHVLHGDEEKSVHFARVVNAHHMRINRCKLCLQNRSAALRLDGIAGVRIRSVLDQFQRDRPPQFRILCQIHIRHAAPPQLLADFVFAELAASGCDHFLCCPRTGFSPFSSRKKFISRTAFRSASAASSSGFFSNTLPTNEGRAPSCAATPARPLRKSELCESQGAEGPEIKMPSPEESRTAFALRTGEAAPRISIPTPAPATSVSSISTSEFTSRMPCGIGIWGPARIRNPLTCACFTSSARIAGPPPMAAALKIASRGTWLRRATPLFSRTCSRYSPPCTSIVSPECAASMAC